MSVWGPFIHEPSEAAAAGQGPELVNIAFTSASPFTLFNLLDGDIIDKVEITVETPWDSASPTVEIGTPLTPDLVFATTESNLKKAQTYLSDLNYRISGNQTLRAIFNHDGATQGSGLVLITVIRP